MKRPHLSGSPGRWLIGASLALFVATWGRAAPPETAVREGLRDHTPRVFAFTGARLVLSPDRQLDKGVLVVRDGKIEAVGPDVPIPADARVWDLAGRTIYPGLIDAYTEAKAAGTDEAGRGSPYWNGLITPQLAMADRYKADDKLNEKLRGQGFAVRLVAPREGVIKGASALVMTSDAPASHAVLKDDTAQHIHLYVSRSPRRDHYPNSPMGAVSLARQAMIDADWYRSAWNIFWSNPKAPRPERNDALETLQHLSNGRQLVVLDADSELYFLRADEFAREFSLRAVMRGSGREYRRLAEIAATGRSVIVPLAFPKPPNVSTAEAAINAAVEDMLHWDFAPENPARLEKAGVKIAFTTHGLADPKEFLPALRKAVERGLSPAGALRALTVTPAEMFGAGDLIGTLEAGKLANLLITDGDLFASSTKLLETWVDGRRYELSKRPLYDPRGAWELKLAGHAKLPKLYVALGGDSNSLEGRISAKPLPPPATPVAKPAATPGAADKASKADKTPPAEKKTKPGDAAHDAEKLDHVALHDARFGAAFDAQPFGLTGVAHLSAVLSALPATTPGPSATPQAVVADDATAAALTWIGEITWPDDTRTPLTAVRTAPLTPAATTPAATTPATTTPAATTSAAATTATPAATTAATRAASFPIHYPLGAFGREKPPETARLLAFQHATIWTCGPQGLLEDATLLIGDGKILAVGKDVAIPADAVVVDARGKQISPGIVDCHSHIATDGGINETGRAITCQVRVGDFIDANDVNIYRQLAGGVTAIHVLHGSANAIGGQNQMLKMRWGATASAMKMTEAPPTVKFALGENPKQSNWGDKASHRYPQTRMGVEQLIRDEFQAAKEYLEQWGRWQEQRTGLPPRRDLELECIAEVLQGRRWIHCHSYRQDEILAFLRLMEEYKVRIGCMQHILEGYKVADAMARHGVPGSSFSDWWAYKFEVMDAIPYNGRLMHDAGVVVSFNSDDRELARHLNQEAAKAVKYGGIPPHEALKFVTLNPAKQLHIDQYVGSLEAGKQADFVVWNGSPLSNFSRPEQTWVDGARYFDLAEDQKSRETIRVMHATLVQKILKSGEKMRSLGEDVSTDKDFWPREDEYCRALPHCRKDCKGER